MPPRPEPRQPDSEPRTTGALGAAVTVLVVDPDPDHAALTARVLRRADLQVCVAHDSELALGVCADTRPQVAVIEYALPGMDGLELLSALRERSPDIVAIMLTGAGDERIAVEALARGAATYLVKDPAGRSRAGLPGKIRRFIDLRRQQREKVRTEAWVGTALTDLQRQNQRLRDFTRLLVHDLRAPVRHVGILIEMALEDCTDGVPDILRETLTRLTDSAHRMERLISDTLALARAEDQSRQQPVDLGALCAEILVDFEGVEATIDVGELPIVDGEPVQLRHLLQNLLDNALKYRSDARPCQVQVRGWSERGRHVVEVSDNGVGFDAEAAERIFEPFTRLSERREGTGLGLAICRQIATACGGKISAEGAPDRGARFRIELPIDRPTTTAPARAAPPPDESEPAPVLAERALDHAPDALLVHDDDGRFVYANYAAARLLRYDRDTLVGMCLADLEPDFDLYGVRKHWQRMQLGDAVRTRGRPTASDGQPVPVEVRMALVNNHPDRWYLVSLRAAKQPGTSELRRGSQPFRAVLEAAPEAALMYDASGRILFANARVAQLLGYTREEVLRLNVSQLDPGGDRVGWVASPPTLPAALRREDDSLVTVTLSSSDMVWEGRAAFLVLAREPASP